MLPERRLVVPTVIHTINVGDRDLRQLLLRDVFQASNVDAVHARADAKNPHSAMFAEEVLTLLRAEEVLRELGLSGNELEGVGLCYPRPEPVPPTDGAVAAEARLSEIEVNLDNDLSAMATRPVALQHALIDPLRFALTVRLRARPERTRWRP